MGGRLVAGRRRGRIGNPKSKISGAAGPVDAEAEEGDGAGDDEQEGEA